MVNKLILFLSIIAPLIGFCSIASIEQRMQYGQILHEAFTLQSYGKTREAYYTFKKGYDYAIECGEDRKKLFSIQSLFIWYRKYGYSLGIMIKPSGCTGEVLDNVSRKKHANSNLSKANRYESEWGNDPIQAAKIRDLVFGFGEVISAAFMLYVGSPPIKAVGVTAAADGFTRIWNACNGLYTDRECAALQRLKEVEDEIKSIK